MLKTLRYKIAYVRKKTCDYPRQCAKERETGKSEIILRKLRIPTGENHRLRDTRGTTGLVSVDKKNRGVQFSDLLDVNAVESSTKHGKFCYKNNKQILIQFYTFSST